MIFGSDEAKTSDVQTDMVRVRALEPEEIQSLTSDQLVYADNRHYEPPILVPAHVKVDSLGTYLDSSNPTVPVRDIYGVEFYARIDEIFEADDLGDEMPVIRNVGARLSSSLFFLGLNPEEAEERLKKALRAEFGSGVVEVWNLRSGLVRDGRWDIYEFRRDWVPREGSRKGKGQPGSWEVAERRLIARAVRDGHQHYFRSAARPGWSVMVEPHQPDTTAVEIL